MKKQLHIFAAILAAAALSFASCHKNEQPDNPTGETTIGNLQVSTQPQNRNAVLEVFTGNRCQYCAKGDRISDSIMAANPGRVSVVNIHQGYFSDRFQTPLGDALAEEFEINGYPSGLINRHTFLYWPAENRDFWGQRCEEIMALPSCLNLKARATVNLTTRHMEVLVEGYYTSSSSWATNRLHVFLVQNNMAGDQLNPEDNPAAIGPDGQYRHQRVLRHTLTGTWGVEVSPTTEGTFFDRALNTTLPADFIYEEVDPREMQVVVFVSLDNHEIITGCDAEMVFVN